MKCGIIVWYKFKLFEFCIYFYLKDDFNFNDMRRFILASPAAYEEVGSTYSCPVMLPAAGSIGDASYMPQLHPIRQQIRMVPNGQAVYEHGYAQPAPLLQRHQPWTPPSATVTFGQYWDQATQSPYMRYPQPQQLMGPLQRDMQCAENLQDSSASGSYGQWPMMSPPPLPPMSPPARPPLPRLRRRPRRSATPVCTGRGPLPGHVYGYDRILGHRKSKSGGLKYELKWTGFSAAESSWEPLASFTNAGEALEEYIEKGTRYRAPAAGHISPSTSDSDEK